jgi:hypothetical protein
MNETVMTGGNNNGIPESEGKNRSKIRSESNAWHMPRDMRVLRLALEMIGNICDCFATCD